MAIETIGAIAAQASSGGAALPATRMVELSPLSNSGVSSFGQSHNNAQLEVRFKESIQKFNGISGASQSSSVPPAMKGLFNALDQINTEAKSVSEFAADAESSGGQLTPGEMVQTVFRNCFVNKANAHEPRPYVPDAVCASAYAERVQQPKSVQ
jgi:hypothetical protein